MQMDQRVNARYENSNQSCTFSDFEQNGLSGAQGSTESVVFWVKIGQST